MSCILCRTAAGLFCLLSVAWLPISTTDAGPFRRRMKCPIVPGRVLVIVEKAEAPRKELPNPILADKSGERISKISLPAKHGFVTVEVEGRWWIFRDGSKDLAAFKKTGEPEKSYTRINAAPYKARLWIFRQNSKDLAEFLKNGDLTKQVIRPGAGPRGMTLKGPDADTIIAYVTAQEGFITFLQDGRLWVFKSDSKDLQEYKKNGELAKHVIRVNAGPLGLTLKAPDGETIDLYLKACGR
jgi:hypothetical protein